MNRRDRGRGPEETEGEQPTTWDGGAWDDTDWGAGR